MVKLHTIKFKQCFKNKTHYSNLQDYVNIIVNYLNHQNSINDKTLRIYRLNSIFENVNALKTIATSDYIGYPFASLYVYSKNDLKDAYHDIEIIDQLFNRLITTLNIDYFRILSDQITFGNVDGIDYMMKMVISNLESNIALLNACHEQINYGYNVINSSSQHSNVHFSLLKLDKEHNMFNVDISSILMKYKSLHLNNPLFRNVLRGWLDYYLDKYNCYDHYNTFACDHFHNH